MGDGSQVGSEVRCLGCGEPADPHGLMCEHVMHRRLLSYTTEGDGPVPDTTCSACAAQAPVDAARRRGMHPVCAGCWADRVAWNVEVGAADRERGYALVPRAVYRLAKGLPANEANLAKLDLGVYAKLSFSAVPSQEETWAEHMWVEVVAAGDGVYEGQLDNEPDVFAPSVLAAGAHVSFHTADVIEARYYAKPPSPPVHDCPRCSVERYEASLVPGVDDPQRATKLRLVETVGRAGWYMLMITGDDDATPFTYTVGLQHTYAHPELIVYGLDGRFAGDVLNHLGCRIASGTRLRAGQVLDDVLEGYEVHLRGVPKSDNDLGFAWWYYGQENLEALELLLVRA